MALLLLEEALVLEVDLDVWFCSAAASAYTEDTVVVEDSPNTRDRARYCLTEDLHMLSRPCRDSIVFIPLDFGSGQSNRSRS